MFLDTFVLSFLNVLKDKRQHCVSPDIKENRCMSLMQHNEEDCFSFSGVS